MSDNTQTGWYPFVVASEHDMRYAKSTPGRRHKSETSSRWDLCDDDDDDEAVDSGLSEQQRRMSPVAAIVEFTIMPFPQALSQHVVLIANCLYAM